MYLINITIKADQVPEDQQAELLAKHRTWFKQEFAAGNFLLVGPYRDRSMAGLVIAQATSREQVEALVDKDAYYPAMANYEINEFQANLISDQVNDFKGA